MRAGSLLAALQSQKAAKSQNRSINQVQYAEGEQQRSDAKGHESEIQQKALQIALLKAQANRLVDKKQDEEN